MINFGAWDKEYKRTNIDFGAWDKEYQMQILPASHAYTGGSDTSEITKPSSSPLRVPATHTPDSGYPVGQAILSRAVSEAVKYPLNLGASVLEHFGFDAMPERETVKLLKGNANYWAEKIPAIKNIPGLSVEWSKKPVKDEIANLGNIRFTSPKISLRQATNIAGQLAGLGAAAGPAFKIATPLVESAAPFLSGLAKKAVIGAVAGAGLGEGDPKKIKEMSIGFAAWETAAYGLGKLFDFISHPAIKEKVMEAAAYIPGSKIGKVTSAIKEQLNGEPNWTDKEIGDQILKEFKKAGTVSPKEAAVQTKIAKSIWGNEDWSVKNDKENQQGLQSNKQQGQEPVPAESDQGASPAQIEAGGNVQTHEEAQKVEAPPYSGNPIDFGAWDKEYQQTTKAATATMESLSKAGGKSDEALTKELATAFGVPHDVITHFDKTGDFPDSISENDKMVLDEYLPELSYAAIHRNTGDIKDILNEINQYKKTNELPDYIKAEQATTNSGETGAVSTPPKESISIEKAGHKIFNNETGRAYILEDLAKALHKPGMKLKEFSDALKEKLGRAFEKIKHLVSGMYERLNKGLDAFTTGRETGAIGDRPKAMELPEIGELARALVGDRVHLVDKIKRAGVSGSYSPGNNAIKLLKSLPKDPEEAAKVFAHEIGHSIDLAELKPGKTGGRNILARIASLKNYMKRFMAEKQGGLGQLTEAEKIALKDEARAIEKKRVSQTIKDEVGIEPEKILDYLRGREHDLPPYAKDYIQQASGETKKSIAKQAMKGLPPQELEQLRESLDNGKKPATHIGKLYEEMLAKEIKRRKLWDAKQLTKELKAHSKEWRPWKEGNDKKYDAYRNSSSELYADAISGLINNPNSFMATAPKFTKAFFNYLGEKPETKRVWDAIQERQNMGHDAIMEERIARAVKGSKEGARLQREAFKKRAESDATRSESFSDQMIRGLHDKYHPILKIAEKAAKAKGPLGSLARRVKTLLMKRPYHSSEIDAYVHDLSGVMRSMDESGIDIHEMDLVGSALHGKENRSDIWNPGVETAKSYQDRLDYLKKKWGDKKYNKSLDILKHYRTLREKYVIPVVEESGIASPKLLSSMKGRDKYLKVSINKYIDELTGGQGGGGFHRQTGSISEKGNSITATMMDDVKTIYAARENIVRRDALKMLAQEGEGAREAVMEGNGKFRKIDERASKIDQRWEEPINVMVDGKIKKYIVDKTIAKVLKSDPRILSDFHQVWNNAAQIMRELMVSSNYKWMIRNIPRDMMGTITRNPDVVTPLRYHKLIASYFKTAPEAFKEAFGKSRSLRIADMMRGKEIPTGRSWVSYDEAPANEIDRVLSHYNFYRQGPKQRVRYYKWIEDQFEGRPELFRKAVDNTIGRVWQFKENAGRGSDIWGKIAARDFFEKYTNLGEEEISRRIIREVGTPDFKQQGEFQDFTNNAALFSNIGLKGLVSVVNAAKRSGGAFFKMAVTTSLAGKALNYAAERPEMPMGKTIHDIMIGIPTWYKDHYYTIPLGLDPNGKSVFIALPMDPVSQFMGAVFAKTLRGEFGGKEGAINEFWNVQPYSLSPLLSVPLMWSEYSAGINPYDFFRRNNVLSKQQMKIGGWDAWKILLKKSSNELGGGLLYRFPSRFESQRQSTLEKTLRTFPGSILGTFVKVSDAGLGEQYDAAWEDEARKSDKKKSEMANEIMGLVKEKGRDVSIALAEAIKKKDPVNSRKILRYAEYIYGNQLEKALLRAPNNHAKLLIIKKAEQLKGVTKWQ